MNVSRLLLSASLCGLAALPLRAAPDDGAAAVIAAATPATMPLTLDQAEMMAVANHPRVAASQAAAQAAEQGIREARSAFFPQVSADAIAVGVNDGKSQLAANGSLGASTMASRQSDGLNGTQLITDFGRTSSLTSRARHLAASEADDAAATRAQVLLGVDQAYFNVLEAQEIVRVADETVAARQLTLDRVNALAQGRLKSELDVSFAKVDLGNARLLQLQARNGLDEAFAQLSNALGYRDERSFQLAATEPYPPPVADLSPLLDHAFRNRPEIAALGQQTEAARKFVSAQRAEQYPTVQAIGEAGVSPVRNSADIDGDYAAAGINLSLPLLNGGKLSAQVSEAQDRAVEAQRLLDSLENDVARDVRAVWLRATTAHRKIGVSEELLANASESLDLAQARYTSGLSSIVELSQAQLNKTQAEIDVASARYDYQILAADLKYQLGDFH